MIAGCLLTTDSYPDFVDISLIFWSTLLIYQINTKIKFNFLDIQSYTYFQPPLGIRIKVVIALIVIIFIHIPFLSFPEIIFLAHLALIATLYNVPDKTKGWIRLPLRSIPILKVFLIAYVWASVSSLLPVIMENMRLFTYDHVTIFVAHFFFILSITLPFDIRDFSNDNTAELITIPQLIGIVPTKILALVCLGIFAVLIFSHLNNWYFEAFLLLTAGLILFSSPHRKDYYFTFFIDGTIILYFLTIFIPIK